MASDIRPWAVGSIPCSSLIICRHVSIVLLLEHREVPH